MKTTNTNPAHDERGLRRQRGNVTFTVDSFNHGIAFGHHQRDHSQDPRDLYYLRLDGQGELVQLRSRYSLHHDEPCFELERHLSRLSRQGVLSAATIYLGTSTDPFFPFDGKFQASMKFLELFRRFTPGLLVVQTRSPLIVIAMPILRALGRHAAVTIGVETNDDNSIARYTPGFPRFDERLRAATALRRFGVEVTLQVAPVLPYGDWRNDAERFAKQLAAHGDFIHVRPLTDGTPSVERKVRRMGVAQRLAQDRKFHWLRADTANPLITALEACAPEKVQAPCRKELLERQLSIFIA